MEHRATYRIFLAGCQQSKVNSDDNLNLQPVRVLGHSWLCAGCKFQVHRMVRFGFSVDLCKHTIGMLFMQLWGEALFVFLSPFPPLSQRLSVHSFSVDSSIPRVSCPGSGITSAQYQQ